MDELEKVSAQMSFSERLFLYSSVTSTQPQNCLEIGSYRGGSTLIISLALEKTQRGRLFSIDCNHQIDEGTVARFAGRTMLIHGESPQAIREAYRAAGALFDFVLIDGNHDAIEPDLEGVFPFLAPECVLLFHDAYYSVVRTAIDNWVKQHSPWLLDHGIVDRSVNDNCNPPHLYGGLRGVTYSPASEHRPSIPLF